MKFQDKNDFIVKNTSAQHFEKDLQLFKKHCPKSRLHSELNRVNSFTRKKLDGYMLNELLDKITVDEILKNRGVKTGSRNKNISPPTGSPAPPAPDKVMNPLASAPPAPEPPSPAPDSKKLEALEQRIKTFENLEERIKALEASKEYTEDEISGLKELQEQISGLEASQDDAASDISDLQDALNEKDTLIEQLQAKIEELEKKTVKKKDETG